MGREKQSVEGGEEREGDGGREKKKERERKRDTDVIKTEEIFRQEKEKSS